MYPVFLVILVVTGNIDWDKDDREDHQIEVTENSLFYSSKPLNIYQNTYTSFSLPWYFRSDHVDNALATNVS